MEVAGQDSSMTSSVEGGSLVDSALVSSQSSGDEAPSGTEIAKVGKAALKRRRSSVRKPRTKGIIKKLQDQVEFYFGDANLPKDKFLLQQVKEGENGYVSVDVVANFKKMQSLTKDRSLVLKAIKNSSLVELSPDSKGLRRTHPLPDIPQSDVDQRTVYVENLPTSTTSHDSITKTFKVFGEIKFISLPRYKSSGDIKGFAFVEFSSKEAAAKAVEFFRIKDTIPAAQRKRKPSKIVSEVFSKAAASAASEMEIAVEEKSQEGLAEREDGAFEEDAQASKERDGSDTGAKEVKEVPMEAGRMVGDVEGEGGANREGNRKRVREDGEEQEEGVEQGEGGGSEKVSSSLPAQKRSKLEDAPQDDQEVTKKDAGNATDVGASQEQKEDVTQKKEGVAQEGEGKEGVAQEGKEGAKKKRNRQHKKKQWPATAKDLNLRVMSKEEWLGMKTMFKDLQKSHMKQFKSEMKGDGTDSRPVKKRFVQDCLVRVELQEKWEESHRDILKSFCEHHGKVAFVDMKDGDMEGFVRYSESGCITQLLQSTDKPSGMTFSAVNEEGERAYFLKTQAEKKQKFKDKKKLKQRGKEKLVSKVLKNVFGYTQAPPMDTVASSSFSSSSAAQPTSTQPTHIKFSDSELSETEDNVTMQ